MVSKIDKISDEEFTLIIKNSLAYRDALNKIGYAPTGSGTMHILKARIKDLNLDTSHFIGSAWNTGRLSENPVGKDAWKARLISERGHQCEKCKRTHWVSGNPIPIELEHIDGNNKNNVDSNLKLLCSNCHSQTKTWKRKKSSLDNPKPTCMDCNKEISYKAKRCRECLDEYYKINGNFKQNSSGRSEARTQAPKHDLCACGQQKLTKSPQCVTCANKNVERIEWPSLEELVRLVSENSYTSVAKTLGVSDVAIRKRIRRAGVEAPTKFVNRYTPEDYLCACGESKKPESKQCQACYSKSKAYSYPEDDVLVQMINESGSIIKTANRLGVTKSSIHKRLDRRNLRQYLKL